MISERDVRDLDLVAQLGLDVACPFCSRDDRKVTNERTDSGVRHRQQCRECEMVLIDTVVIVH